VLKVFLDKEEDLFGINRLKNIFVTSGEISFGFALFG
jgi:hypothetical protein